MEILLIEPYFTGSHRSWAEGLRIHSRHTITLLTMPGNFWKWRMHGGSITLAREFLEKDFRPDLIIATDMLDLSSFLGLTRKKTHGVPVLFYFHENQLTYPWSPTDRDIQNRRDMHYSFINLISALSADHVSFNSEYHRSGFLKELHTFLKQFPDFNEFSSIELIESRSSVLPVGIDLSRFDQFKSMSDRKNRSPLILWNHRWEYDKNPSDFFDAVYELKKNNLDFKLIILGEHFVSIPEEFEKASKKLSDSIVKFGFADNFEEYATFLWESDIIPVTSNQDFFGISIVEAVYCDTLPLLPERLAYTEIFPPKQYRELFYQSREELIGKLITRIINPGSIDTGKYKTRVSRYDWRNIIDRYDTQFESLAR